MGEPTQYKFSLKEVAEALVRKQGIHEGIWGLLIEFGLAAGHTGPSKDEMYPTALVPVMKIGLHELKEETNFSVDAAKVNPQTESSEADQSGPSYKPVHIKAG